MDRERNWRTISRRQLGVQALISGASLLLPRILRAASTQGAVPGEGSDQQQGASSQAARVSGELESRYQSTIRKWADRLSEEQRRHVRRILEANEAMLDPIRNFQLENSDPPAAVLRFYSDEELVPKDKLKSETERQNNQA